MLFIKLQVNDMIMQSIIKVSSITQSSITQYCMHHYSDKCIIDHSPPFIHYTVMYKIQGVYFEYFGENWMYIDN